MDLTMILFLGMMVPANGFPLLYSTFYRWWQNPIGRALMTKAIGLALVIDVSLLHFVFGDYPGRDAIRNAALALVVVGLWYQFIVFLRIKRESRRKAYAES